MDMSQALGGLRCKINPGPRTHAASVYFKQRLILLGGRSGEDELKNDAWYRDDRTPTAFVANAPSSYTSGRSVAGSSKHRLTCFVSSRPAPLVAELLLFYTHIS